jgi:hypothetical protein
MATAIIIALVTLGLIIVMISVYYEERKRMLRWHHEMMLDAWQDGWDAAVSMMESREETKR